MKPIQLLTVPEAAKRLCVSETTVWRLRRKRELPSVKIGTATRIPAEAVDQFVADQLPEPARRTRRRSG